MAERKKKIMFKEIPKRKEVKNDERIRINIFELNLKGIKEEIIF